MRVRGCVNCAFNDVIRIFCEKQEQSILFINSSSDTLLKEGKYYTIYMRTMSMF